MAKKVYVSGEIMDKFEKLNESFISSMVEGLEKGLNYYGNNDGNNDRKESKFKRFIAKPVVRFWW